ncbi:ABC transporter permease [Qipengyuania sp. NPDC077563]|uniref:ABC transporter permease n=1 Tax=Qipengyuania sp. NPDC077563 TaxID=3364497 RepID=UPI00384B4DF4
MSWANAWRIARRDLNARFKGLRLLLVCIFLGTAALAAIGSLTAAIERELEANGQTFLGGDIQVELWQRSLNADERAALEQLGTVSAGTRLQAMARKDDLAAPIELKAVDEAYPLYGSLVLEGQGKSPAPTGNQAFLAPGAADRLGVRRGDSFAVGTQTLTVAGIIEDEPDRLGEGFQLGPTIMVAEDLPRRAGLLEPGSMYQSKTRLALAETRDLEAIEQDLEDRFPDAGFDIDTAENGAPGTDRFIERMSEFLTLVGLAALVIAGIGIGGGVTSYLDARRQSIATLKVLGADSRDIARIYALQIFAASAVGSIAGLVVGVAVVPVLAQALEGLLPVNAGFVIDPGALALAAAYGFLVALVFAAPPLMRARHFPAMALMRARVAPLARDRSAMLVVTGGLAAIVGLALLTSSRPLLAGGFLFGAAIVLGLLALLGWLIRKGAAALPRPQGPIARAALANIYRPGSSTGSLVTALGFGLAAFVLLAAIQSSIDGNIQSRVPERAPDYFVLDVPRDREADFRALVTQADSGASVRAVPALRGAVLAFGPEESMTRTSSLEEIPDGAWALRGERGLTYADEVPEGNELTDGSWWGPMYVGEPLVSVDKDFAEAAGLKIGDKLTFGVLGAEIETRIASLRTINWESLGFNYVFVLSPNALRDTPHNLAATIELSDGTPTGPLLQALVREFPSTSVIEVGGVLQQARTILEQVGIATLAAASVAVLAGLAVLLGAIAAARASRTYDTVVLRVLGADRRQVLAMQLAEYALLAGALALVALGLGTLTAWLVVTQLFEFDWLPDWGQVFAVLGLGLAVVVAFAVGGSLPLLRSKPAQVLRAL